MDRLPLIISGLTGTAGRLGGIAAQILQDRLELLALELREAKIRFVQALLLASIGVAFLMLGLLLLVLAGVYLLSPEWRFYGFAATAVASICAGVIVFMALSRHLNRKQLGFDQSLAELKKDATCFSTGK
ncbi:MAG: phage holin family protein [Syntrophaceae bacterium]|nr:phage holin family protein [Syntrophaceae bacterium]